MPEHKLEPFSSGEGHNGYDSLPNSSMTTKNVGELIRKSTVEEEIITDRFGMPVSPSPSHLTKVTIEVLEFIFKILPASSSYGRCRWINKRGT